jgi:DNA gyrase subunit B
MPKLEMESMGSEAAVQQWCSALQGQLDALQESGSEVYTVVPELDREHSLYVPKISILLHGISDDYRLDVDFFRSRDYVQISSLGDELQSLLADGAYLTRGERRMDVTDLGEGINWLMDLARRGSSFQRYKGLGEMNPDQLWETTMDPDARRMLQVTIDDAISADQLFTTLMGDEVEPRRNFIESNALNVANLDV